MNRHRGSAHLVGTVLIAWLALSGRAAEPHGEFLASWIEAQGRMRTWSAEFTQTRTLKALREPLRTPGRLWFAAPGQFRWELGQPAQTLALRRTNELLVVYPRLKRVERYPLGGTGREPWRDALALLDAGFPTSVAELESRFHVRGLATQGERAELTLEPRSPAATRFLSEVRLTFTRPTFALVANEMRFSDGSVLRNDFTNAVVNPALPPAWLEFDLPADFKQVEPLSR